MDASATSDTARRRWLFRALYAAAIALFLAAAVNDFITIRARTAGQAGNQLDFVSKRRTLYAAGSAELRTLHQISLWADGLSWIETDRDHQIRRHGLAPATHLAIGDADVPLTVRWRFFNSHPGQQLTVRLDGTVLSSTAVATGESVGEAVVPAHNGMALLALEFSRSQKPEDDAREITVVFSSLQVSCP